MFHKIDETFFNFYNSNKKKLEKENMSSTRNDNSNIPSDNRLPLFLASIPDTANIPDSTPLPQKGKQEASETTTEESLETKWELIGKTFDVIFFKGVRFLKAPSVGSTSFFLKVLQCLCDSGSDTSGYRQALFLTSLITTVPLPLSENALEDTRVYGETYGISSMFLPEDYNTFGKKRNFLALFT